MEQLKLAGEEERVQTLSGLSPVWQIAVFVVAILTLVSRCPSLITHAQFYAEDGTIWFAQAYNDGWLHSLLLPQAGYLNTMPRLASGLALLFPLQWAPLVLAIAGLLTQALPAPILLSSRCRNWGSLAARVGLAAIYLELPNKEIHVVVTNAQWHLAVAAALLAFSSSPLTWLGRGFDAIVLLVASLSGPFGIILAPLVLLFWWLRRQPWSLATFALIGIGSCVQLGALLHGGPRVQNSLGATAHALLRILGGDIFGGAILGGSSFPWRAPMALIVLSAAVGLAIYLYCLYFANLEWKFFLVYCAAVFAASMRSPLTEGGRPAWDSLVFAVSARYWFLPMLAFTWSALWCACYARDHLFKAAGTGVLLFMLVGAVRDWEYQAFPAEHFALAAKRMRDAQPGDHVMIPIVPEGWRMELIKRR